jgi:hypothetical protein
MPKRRSRPRRSVSIGACLEGPASGPSDSCEVRTDPLLPDLALRAWGVRGSRLTQVRAAEADVD